MNEKRHQGATHQVKIEQALRKLGHATARQIAKEVDLTPQDVSGSIIRMRNVEGTVVTLPARWQGDPDHEFFRVVHEFRARAVDGFTASEVVEDTGIPLDRVRLILRTVHDTYRAVRQETRHTRVKMYQLVE